MGAIKMQVNRRWAVGSIIGGVLGLFGLKEVKSDGRICWATKSVVCGPDKTTENALDKYNIFKITLCENLQGISLRPRSSLTNTDDLFIILDYDMKYKELQDFILNCMKENPKGVYFTYIVSPDGRSNCLCSEELYHVVNHRNVLSVEILRGDDKFVSSNNKKSTNLKWK